MASSRKRSGLRKGLIGQYASARKVDPKDPTVKAVEAIIERAKKQAVELGLKPVQGIGDLKGTDLVPFLDEIAEYLEELKAVVDEARNPSETDGFSGSSGSSGRSNGTPKNRIPKKLQQLFDSALEKDLVSGSLADFIGGSDLEEALIRLRGLHAEWHAAQKAAHQKTVAAVIEGSGTSSDPEGLKDDGRLSPEQIDELRLHPEGVCEFCKEPLTEDHVCPTEEVITRTRPRRGEEEVESPPVEKKSSRRGSKVDTRPPTGGPEGGKVEAKPAANTSAPRKVEEASTRPCELPISGFCAGKIVTVRASSEEWGPWLEYIFGAPEAKMCENCATRLGQILGGDLREARMKLGEIAEAVGRPFETCIVGLKGCEKVAPETIYKGNRWEFEAILDAKNGGRDNGHACASCKVKLRGAATTYHEGGREKLQKYLAEMEIPMPTPEPVKEVVKEEPIAACEICGGAMKREWKLTARPMQLAVCKGCWEIGREPLVAARQIADPIEAVVALAEKFGVDITRGIKGQITRRSSEGPEAVATYLATKIGGKRVRKVFAAVAELLIEAAKELAARKPCLNPFHRYGVQCDGFVTKGDSHLCESCRRFWESVEKYKGPHQRLKLKETYYYRCSNPECHDAGGLTGQRLLDFGPPPPEKLLCHSCYEKKMATERATWPKCPNPYAGEGFEGCKGHRPPKGEAKGNGEREFYPLCVACYAHSRHMAVVVTTSPVPVGQPTS